VARSAPAPAPDTTRPSCRTGSAARTCTQSTSTPNSSTTPAIGWPGSATPLLWPQWTAPRACPRTLRSTGSSPPARWEPSRPAPRRPRHRAGSVPALVGCFMRRRSTAGPSVGTPRPIRTLAAPTMRTTAVDPAQLDGGARFSSGQLHLPHGVFRSIWRSDDGDTVTMLRTAHGASAHANQTLMVAIPSGRPDPPRCGPTSRRPGSSGPTSVHRPGASSDSPPPRRSTPSGSAPHTVRAGCSPPLTPQLSQRSARCIALLAMSSMSVACGAIASATRILV
jgi:hypothetical protein